jgi:hypothetical protein
VKGRDLALAVAKEIVAGGKAFQQKNALGGAIPLPDDVFTSGHHSWPDGSPLQQLSFLVGEAIKVLEFADQPGVQDGPPLGQPRALSWRCVRSWPEA